eukprot:4642092-Prorocentrum_lima.AAC.1
MPERRLLNPSDNIRVIVSTTTAWCKARIRSGSTTPDRIAVRKQVHVALCDEMQAIDIFCATAS